MKYLLNLAQVSSKFRMVRLPSRYQSWSVAVPHVSKQLFRSTECTYLPMLSSGLAIFKTLLSSMLCSKYITKKNFIWKVNHARSYCFWNHLCAFVITPQGTVLCSTMMLRFVGKISSPNFTIPCQWTLINVCRPPNHLFTVLGCKTWDVTCNFPSHAVWPDWAIFWTLGKFLKPLATINLPKSPTF